MAESTESDSAEVGRHGGGSGRLAEPGGDPLLSGLSRTVTTHVTNAPGQAAQFFASPLPQAWVSAHCYWDLRHQLTCVHCHAQDSFKNFITVVPSYPYNK